LSELKSAYYSHENNSQLTFYHFESLSKSEFKARCHGDLLVFCTVLVALGTINSLQPIGELMSSVLRCVRPGWYGIGLLTAASLKLI
jgi:hypothetical protein